MLNANRTQVSYGQTTDAARTSNLITVEPIYGRHASIDVDAAIFSGDCASQEVQQQQVVSQRC
ncbi:hypothetical protein Mapa_011346 [Marchantia paleacea]|nr:hypothetical protein Mapa_011346 [Marchantia paleacea]